MSDETLEQKKTRHYAFINESYLQLAALAWQSFQESGRGIVRITINPATGGSAAQYYPPDALGESAEEMANEYDPESQFVLVISEPDGPQSDYRLGTANMTPPMAYEILNSAEGEDEISEEDQDDETEGRFPDFFPTIVLAFVVIGDGEYGTEASELLFDALLKIKFTGFCEYYAIDVPTDTNPLYMVGFALANDEGSEPATAYIDALTALMEEKVGEEYSKLSLVACKSDTLDKARGRMLFRGTAEFREGHLKRIVQDEESLFIAGCYERMGHKEQ
jgi:hypothetical protein